MFYFNVIKSLSSQLQAACCHVIWSANSIVDMFENQWVDKANSFIALISYYVIVFWWGYNAFLPHDVLCFLGSFV